MKDLETTDVEQQYIEKFKNFENRLNGSKKIPFHQLRRDAISRFEELGFPSTRTEEWKYTNIAPLLQHDFSIAEEPIDVSVSDIESFLICGLTENTLVFVNGKFRREFSTAVSKKPGLIIGSLRDALKNGDKNVGKYLSNYLNYKNETFAALNTAFTLDGAYVYLPENFHLEHPIHLLNIASSSETAFQSHPRNLIIAGKGSQVQIVETHEHLTENVYFHNAATEMIIEEGATVDHIKLQKESPNAFRIATMQIDQRRDSIFNTINIDLGGALVRNNTNLVINGENCNSNMCGFYLVSGTQHIDNQTNIEHAQPNCESNELFKGILADKSRGVFSGTIYVHPHAQKTNAFQSNKNLLLSEEAEIDSKPQLKIFADDVKCSHGATIGQLDRDALFYLRQRGLDEREANAVLRHAFAADIFSRIEIDSVRERVDSVVTEKLKTVR